MRSSDPVATSHSRAVPSTLPERARRPSGEKVTQQIPIVCPDSRRSSWPVATSQRRRGFSSEPERIRRASGERATARTFRSCPASRRSLAAGPGVPDPHGAVEARGDRQAAVARDRHVGDLVLVPLEPSQLAAGREVPEADRPVLAPGEGPPAVAREGQGLGVVGVTFEAPDRADELAGLRRGRTG